MLRLEAVTKTYQTRQGPVKALDNVSLEVGAGEFLVVHGPSGCGKTTLLLTIGGMLRPSPGKVMMDRQDLYALPPGERARFRAQKIGFVFQMFHLVPYLNVLENVLLAASSDQKAARRAKARELLVRFGLESRLDHKSEQLSAGERQRTAIARALLNQPQLILADEPTGNLDPENGAQVLHHLAEFHRQGGTVILVTHSPMTDEASYRLVELQAGSIRCRNDSCGESP